MYKLHSNESYNLYFLFADIIANDPIRHLPAPLQTKMIKTKRRKVPNQRKTRIIIPPPLPMSPVQTDLRKPRRENAQSHVPKARRENDLKKTRTEIAIEIGTGIEIETEIVIETGTETEEKGTYENRTDI